jgi:hypothetical protein
MIQLRKSDGRYVVKCSGPHCTLAVACKTSEEALALEDSHTCPHINGVSHYAWSITVTLVEELWQKLDEGYARLLRPDGTALEREFVKGRLRGLAEATCIFMKPHFTNPDDIVREVVKRRQSGPDYETPGLGQRRYEAPPGTVHPQRESVTARPEVDQSTLKAIHNGHEAGMTLVQLGNIFKMSVVHIQELLKIELDVPAE